MQRLNADVAVVGGGPAGLSLALALRQHAPALSVQVFDKAPGLYKRGAGVAVNPNGTAALRSINPAVASAILALAPPRSSAVTEDADGRVLSRQQLVFGGAPKPPGQSMDALIPWHAMQRVLAEALPPGAVQYRKSFSGLEVAPDDSWARVTFADGTDCTASVVVGADGLLSPLREAWLHDGAPPFDNRVVFRGQAPTEAVRALPSWGEGIDSKIVPTGKGITCMLYAVEGGVTVWAIGANYSAVQECGVNYTPYARGRAGRASLMEPEEAGAACYAEALKLRPLLPQTVVDVLEVAIPGASTIHGEYARPADSYPSAALGAGPVTLVGDAFHPLKVAGIGANLAWEDAAVLAHHIAHAGPAPAALRAYEAARLPRLRTIAQHISDVMAATARTKGEAYIEVKRRQAEFEAAVVHVFDDPFAPASGAGAATANGAGGAAAPGGGGAVGGAKPAAGVGAKPPAAAGAGAPAS